MARAPGWATDPHREDAELLKDDGNATWAGNSAPPGSAAWAPPSAHQDATPGSASPHAAPQNPDAWDHKRLGQKALLLRMVNIGVSGFLAFAALLKAVTALDFTTGVVALYLLIGAGLLCCFEVHLKAMAVCIAGKCGFVYNPIPRVIFMVFLGFLSFGLGLFGIIAGAVLLACSLFTLYLYCFFPEFRELQYRAAEEDLGSGAAAYAAAHPDQAAQVLGTAWRASQGRSAGAPNGPPNGAMPTASV